MTFCAACLPFNFSLLPQIIEPIHYNLYPEWTILLLFPKSGDAGVPMIPLHKVCDLPESICKSIIIPPVDRSSNPDDCHVVWVIPGRAETGSAFVITNV